MFVQHEAIEHLNWNVENRSLLPTIEIGILLLIKGIPPNFLAQLRIR